MSSRWYRPSVRDIVTPQFVGHDLPWLATVASQKATNETLCGTAVPARMQEHINHFAVPVHRAPEVMLFSVYTHENFADEKCIAIPTMRSLQSPSTSRYSKRKNFDSPATLRYEPSRRVNWANDDST